MHSLQLPKQTPDPRLFSSSLNKRCKIYDLNTNRPRILSISSCTWHNPANITPRIYNRDPISQLDFIINYLEWVIIKREYFLLVIVLKKLNSPRRKLTTYRKKKASFSTKHNSVVRYKATMHRRSVNAHHASLIREKFSLLKVLFYHFFRIV